MNPRAISSVGLGASLLLGCQLWGAPLADPDCNATAIDMQAELLGSTPWLRDDPRARNAGAGSFGFAGQLATLRARQPGFDAQALWDIVGNESATEDAALPFRLLALVNRTDLAEQLAPESPAGEGRLVYTLTAGPGDDLASPALPLTVIFEYSLGSAHSARERAAAFHALGHSSPEPRADAASALVESFIGPEAVPGAPYLSQIRVNDGRSGLSELYELALDDSGALRRRGLRNTPRAELAGSPELTSFLLDNAALIKSGAQRVPVAWLAESASLGAVAWLPTQRELQHDFSRGTCTGCHGDDGPGTGGFHLAEAADGSVTLSRFLTGQDLPRRAALMRQRLCAN